MEVEPLSIEEVRGSLRGLKGGFIFKEASRRLKGGLKEA